MKKLSQKNKYWLDDNRYRELKYFCLQYPDWEKAYQSFCEVPSHMNLLPVDSMSGHGDPTYWCAVSRDKFSEKMKLVIRAANAASEDLSSYILRGVTEGLSFEQLVSKMGIPCSRDTYYKYYRKFFWLLSKEKD